MINDLKTERDELSLQIHLGKQEVKSEMQALGDKLDELNQRFEPLKEVAKETSEDVWDAMKIVAQEIQNGFHRIRKSLQ
jgi:uncharacterized coiled-coil DUF342 family protein